MEKIKFNHGGSRVGAGAKPKYIEPTTTVSFRVPISSIQEIKELVLAVLDRYKYDKENGNLKNGCK